MPSLSNWDRYKLDAEGRRYVDDIEAGNRGMDAFLAPIKKQKGYNPRLIFTMGNHEWRIERFVSENPWLFEKMGYHDLNLEDWEIYDFLHPVSVDGVLYSHYFINPRTGKPRGGTVQNRLKWIQKSFTQGHTQEFDYCNMLLPDRRKNHGLVAGAFYRHNEKYHTPQGDGHWRGCIYKHGVKEGDYDLECWSLNRIMRVYG